MTGPSDHIHSIRFTGMFSGQIQKCPFPALFQYLMLYFYYMFLFWVFCSALQMSYYLMTLLHFRVTGKMVGTASQESIQAGTKLLDIPLNPETNMTAL